MRRARNLPLAAALAATALIASACELEDPLDGVGGDTEAPIYAAAGSIWSGDIPVCFENPAVVTEDRLGWIEAAAYTYFIDPDGKFWPSKRKYCLSVGTVHEFGHALGFAHEHNRPDTPNPAPVPVANCADYPQGGNGTETLGRWDPWSVMLQSYCGVSSTGHLTPTDIAGAQYYCGHKSDDYLWYVDRNMQEIRGDDSLAAAISITNLAQSISGHYTAFTGDFDGDGHGDIFWYRPGSGSDFRHYCCLGAWTGRPLFGFLSETQRTPPQDVASTRLQRFVDGGA